MENIRIVGRMVWQALIKTCAEYAGFHILQYNVASIIITSNIIYILLNNNMPPQKDIFSNFILGNDFFISSNTK